MAIPFGKVGNDQVDLSENAPVLSDNFTLEARVYSDNITLNYHWRSIMGSEQGVNAANLLHHRSRHQQFLILKDVVSHLVLRGLAMDLGLVPKK